MSFSSVIPHPEAVLALEPEELAGARLQYLNSLGPADRSRLNRYNFSLHHNVSGYASEYRDRISEALMEAWVWLEREGLIAPKPGTQGKWVFITRRGQKLASAVAFELYRRSDVLPRRLLHPKFAQKVWATFMRGDYDTAVFQAFKEVEVAVRHAAQLADTDIGVGLMRKAFEPGKGAPCESATPAAEQEAFAHLFAGAIGCYKNPHSHRSVKVDAAEAVEML